MAILPISSIPLEPRLVPSRDMLLPISPTDSEIVKKTVEIINWQEQQELKTEEERIKHLQKRNLCFEMSLAAAPFCIYAVSVIIPHKLDLYEREGFQKTITSAFVAVSAMTAIIGIQILCFVAEKNNPQVALNKTILEINRLRLERKKVTVTFLKLMSKNVEAAEDQLRFSKLATDLSRTCW